MAFSARIVADSLAPSGARLTTWVLTYPRWIHSEIMTHREFSRNAASSRAIPVAKMIKQVIEDPALPVHWGTNRSGMQAGAEVPDSLKRSVIEEWLLARDNAVASAQYLWDLQIHKQVTNRLLEPFMWMTSVVSSTDFANFFAQRDHPDAQPEFAHLAGIMHPIYDASTPKRLKAGEWHLPFYMADSDAAWPVLDVVKACTGRCARTSYLTHDGRRDIDQDFDLHDRLLNAYPKHMSPFEHCAMASDQMVQSGNFKGFVQYRKMVAGEYISSYGQDVVGIPAGRVVQMQTERLQQIDEALTSAEVAMSAGCYEQARAFMAAARTHGAGRMAA